ncbi:urease accessory protein UreD [Allorhizobium sp. BGMRC 0089]|uniref:urease accessory protein UreD n=1 Tax=Allorhizobium sonneratiae TaxID=2934936 RepID=UPI002033A7F7|nr:urease accessory protein UreD [Allorhizobium sonneratiae]MCM2291032.1 urease accessory protein UreD [Allorhizobium sonneratiae]
MDKAVSVRAQRAEGEGRLVTKALHARTRLDALYQQGCAKIRIPESFDGRMEAVLINSSGGLTGGDRLAWDFSAAPETHLTLTTQACEKIYKAAADTAAVSTRISVAKGAAVHWLPQESILFDQASLTRRLEVDLEEGAEFLAVEAVLLGRKARGETMREGLVRDRWRIRRGGELVHAEDLALPGREAGAVAEVAGRAASLAGQAAFATLLYIGPDTESRFNTIRRLLEDEVMAGVSEWNGKLLARFACEDGFSLRKLLIPVISVLRGGATLPKVWTL